MRSWLGDLKSIRIVVMIILGWGIYLYSCLFIYIYIYIYIVHSSPFLCVCGDDRITCYPGADDVTGRPGDA